MKRDDWRDLLRGAIIGMALVALLLLSLIFFSWAFGASAGVFPQGDIGRPEATSSP